MSENTKVTVRILLALMLIVLMSVVAYPFGVEEALIPEISALAIGLWVQNKQIWRINRWQTVVLLTMIALLAVFINNLVPHSFSLRVSIVYVLVVGLLVIMNVTLTPAFAVGMLPVMLNTTSYIYPIIVLVFTLTLTLGQYCMDRVGLREYEELHHPKRATWDNLLRWVSLLLVILPILIASDLLDHRFCMAPPLIVAFVELANSKGGFRFRLPQTWLILVFSAMFGTFARVLLLDTWHLFAPLAVLVAEMLVFGMFNIIGKRFAPACALALIPFIMPTDSAVYMPVYAAASALYFIVMARLFFIRDNV